MTCKCWHMTTCIPYDAVIGLRWRMKEVDSHLVWILLLAPSQGSVVGEIEEDSFLVKMKTKWTKKENCAMCL